MGRTPCCDKKGLKKGPWTSDEDELLVNYIKNNNGHGSWRSLPKLAGLLRCGKSCRLRWTNYLRPDIKRGPFTQEEEKLIIQLHSMLGNRWAAIASQLPGRTDNEIKNLWNTHLKKRLLCMGLDPQTHEALTLNHCPAAGASSPASPATRHMAQWESARLEAEARLSRESSLFGPPPPPPQPCSKTDSDYFLRLWNSEVGDSFRNLTKREGVKAEEPDCHGSPASQASSSTKCGSVSALTTEVDPACAAGLDATPFEKTEFCTEEHCAMAAQSDCSSSNDMDDESDTALQLLLDFPINNDMSFLEGNCDDYAAATDRALFSENSFLCPL